MLACWCFVTEACALPNHVMSRYWPNHRFFFNAGRSRDTDCYFKGTQKGPLLVLVSPCFRENVIVTCQIVSFLCSLDNFLLKNVIVFFSGNQISKWRSFEWRAIFDLLFLVTREKAQKFLQHISHLHTFCSPYSLVAYVICGRFVNNLIFWF